MINIFETVILTQEPKFPSFHVSLCQNCLIWKCLLTLPCMGKGFGVWSLPEWSKVPLNVSTIQIWYLELIWWKKKSKFSTFFSFYYIFLTPFRNKQIFCNLMSKTTYFYILKGLDVNLTLQKCFLQSM